MRGWLLLVALAPLNAMATPLCAQFGPEGAQARIQALPKPRDPSLPTIFYIGDSTVRNGGGTGADGLWGWADETPSYFDTTKVNVVNRALGGRSSRAYLTEGLWASTVAMLKPGDIVIMQFGHNDGGPLNDTSRARGTIKGIGDDSVA